MDRHKFSLLIILISFLGCSSGSNNPVPETPSEVLNDFVSSASFQYINLDEVPVYPIVVAEQDIIYSTFDEKSVNQPLIAQITLFTLFRDNFYVYDRQSEGVFKLDKTGNVSGPFTRSGSGPAEHQFPGSLSSNRENIYLADLGNARIIKFDENMEPAGYIDEYHPVGTSKALAVNDHILLTANHRSTGFVPTHPSEGLIAVTHNNRLSDTLSVLLPRIIPPGYQPNVYNNPFFSVNLSGQIAATYHPLPWIFLFGENFEHKHTLIFQYSAFDDMDIPKLDFFKPQGNEGYGGRMPLSQFKIFDDGSLFITIGIDLIYLRKINQNHYEAAARYRFKADGEEEYAVINEVYKEEGVNRYYAGNWQYLFRFDLED